MIKFAPYISIYDLNEKFDFKKEVIWIFSKNLEGIGSQRQRFNIHIVNDTSEERKWLDGSIKSIWKYFDQSNFSKSSTVSKKEQMLTLIRDSFLEIAKDLDWDTKKINDAYQTSLDENIKFHYLTKPKYNKTRTQIGLFGMKLKSDKVIITATILDKNETVLIKKEILETFTHQVDWFRSFNNFKWIDEKNFGFEFGPELTLSISETGVNWNHKNSDTDLGFIRSITYQKFENEKDRIEWMNK